MKNVICIFHSIGIFQNREMNDAHEDSDENIVSIIKTTLTVNILDNERTMSETTNKGHFLFSLPLLISLSLSLCCYSILQRRSSCDNQIWGGKFNYEINDIRFSTCLDH